ncbi:MAG TPA: hypothetical protein VG799_09015, partial [Gemmatimonadota bacterium]|nr:hypothetical protein [Gemmatimonadota bacterium]
MIKINTQVVDTVPESQREALRGEGVTTIVGREPGEFDTRAFTVPDRALDPNGRVKAGLGKKAIKCFDWALCRVAALAFDSIQLLNRYRPNPSFTPKWSEKPLLKSWEKSKPRLGWPRETDSLCPQCVV